MSIEDFLDLASLHPDVLNGDSLMKIFTYVPQFKNDILLVQDSKWPPNISPRYLPKSVTLLLAIICETTNNGMDRLWSLLREVLENCKPYVYFVCFLYSLFLSLVSIFIFD